MTDFDATLGDDYSIYRINGFDVCIGRTKSGTLVLRPEDHADTGPLDRYIVTPDYILARNWGSKPRNAFPGDTLLDVDRSRQVFFTIRKGTDEVVGPLSEQEFLRRPEVAALPSLQWQTPIPDPGSMKGFDFPWFIALPLLLLIYAVLFYWVSVPLLVAIICLLWFLRRRWRQRDQRRRAASLP